MAEQTFLVIEPGGPVIVTDGDTVKATYPHVTAQTFEPGLKAFQSIVGGYIELVRASDTVGLLVNEEGKFGDYRQNIGAHILAQKFGLALHPGDFIAGTAVFVGLDDGPDLKGTPEAVLEVARRAGWID